MNRGQRPLWPCRRAMIPAALYAASLASSVAAQRAAEIVAVSPSREVWMGATAREGVLVIAGDATPENSPFYVASDRALRWVPLYAVNDSVLVVRYGAEQIGWLWLTSPAPRLISGMEARPLMIRATESALLVATASAGGGTEITRVEAGGQRTTVANLRAGLRLYDIELSADARHVAYAADTVLSTGSRLVRLEVHGPDRRRTLVGTVLPRTNLALSPDGSRLVFSQWESTVRYARYSSRDEVPPEWFVWNLGDGSVQPIVVDTLRLPTGVDRREVRARIEPPFWTHGSAAFSPDGRRIALSMPWDGIAVFALPENGAPQLEALVGGGATLRRLRWFESGIISVVDSRDGKPWTSISRLRSFRHQGRTSLYRYPDVFEPAPEIARLLATRPLPPGDTLQGSEPYPWTGLVVLRRDSVPVLHLPIEETTLRLRRARQTDNAATARLFTLVRGDPDLSPRIAARFEVFDDGRRFVVSDAAGPRVMTLGSPTAITPGTWNPRLTDGTPDADYAFAWLSPTRWTLVDTSTAASNGDRRHAVLVDGTQRTDIQITPGYDRQLLAGWGGFLSGEPYYRRWPWGAPIYEDLLAYTDAGERYFYDEHFYGSFVLHVASRLTDQPRVGGVLLLRPRTSQDPVRGELVWKRLTSGEPLVVLESDIAGPPQAVLDHAGSRMGALVKRSGTPPTYAARLWALDAGGVPREIPSQQLRAVDAALLVQQQASTPGPLWAASPDLKVVAIPVGERIRIVDVDRDKVLATAELGTPVALGSDYLLLRRADGSYTSQPYQRTP